MKIAQIAPLAESCPPRLYGGTERIVSYLTEEFVRRGHEVTLFASGDSCTSARLEPSCEVALRLDPRIKDPIPHHIVMLEKVRALAPEFDVLHFHVDVLHYPFLHSFVDKTVTTLHGRLDLAELKPVYSTYRHAPLVSISNNQRGPMPPVNWVGNVYHGLPRDLLPVTVQPREGHLAFLGSIAPEKRPDRAIEIATRAGVKLKMAAKVDRVDQVYWDEVIKPLVDSHPNVEFLGEINERQKARFLGEASALIFPIDWPEPFGLVLIEAMACGTPVIAFRSGSTPEVIDDGVTGFLVNGVEAAAAAVTRVTELNRAKIRARFDERFAIERVAEDYLNIYRALPGVRRAARRISASHQAELGRLGAPIYRKPSSFPGLQRLGPPQAAPAE
jgi:glycosyltransferase involved in cell wall biosynthesis